NEEMNSLIPEVEGKYLIMGDFPSTSYRKAYYSYWAIYYNLPSVGGWYPHVKDVNYLNHLINFYDNIEEEVNCEIFREESYYLNITSIISYKDKCPILEECGFKEKIKKDNVCLYLVE
ncbi:hypothetical protein K8R47_02135, partial [archaeon]|nr:hypothetical protein [archaeon]